MLTYIRKTYIVKQLFYIFTISKTKSNKKKIKKHINIVTAFRVKNSKKAKKCEHSRQIKTQQNYYLYTFKPESFSKHLRL